MEYSFWGGLMLMLLMADPVGNIPLTLACLKTVPNQRRLWVLARECVIAGGILILAMFFGRQFMQMLGLSDAALSIGGAVIVMMMAIRMVFPSKEGIFGETPGGEPMIRETECFSMNSDISKRIKDSGVSNRSSASRRTSSVFPTPVGPSNMTSVGFNSGRRRDYRCSCR